MYYKLASKRGCAKAYNSLGNMIKKKYITPEKIGKTAKEFYRLAAINRNIHGMCHFALELEGEILLDLDMKKNENSLYKKYKKMLEYLKESADMGYSVACYKYAVYLGGFDDERRINESQCTKFGQETDVAGAILYLRKAIDFVIDEPCYNAMILLCECIFTYPEYICKSLRDKHQEVKDYLENLETVLINTKKATKWQTKKIEKIKKTLQSRSWKFKH